MNNDKIKAIVFMLLSSLSFAAMGAFVKLSGDLPTFQKAFFRNFIVLFVTIYIVIRKKQNPWGQKINRKYLIGRGIFGTIGMIFYFYGIDRLILADSGMLNKISPFFVTIFAAIFLKDKITKHQVFSLFIAMSGVMFIIKPSFEFQESFPAIVCFMSAVFAGAAYTFISYLSDKEDKYTIIFYFSLISTIITLPVTLLNFHPLSTIQLIYLLSSGITAAFGQLFITSAYKYALAGEVSIYNYSNVIFSSILGIIFFSEVPDIFSFIGYFMIFGAGYIVYKFGRNKENKQMKNCV